jgi:MFS family permease
MCADETDSDSSALSADDRRIQNEDLISSPFTRLSTAHALSVAGDAMVTVAMAGSIFFTTSVGEARSRVALSLLLTMAPFAVVAPILGPRIDRVRGGRKVVVVTAAAGRALLAFGMSFVVADGNLLLYPLLFACLVLSKTHSIARASLVPSTVSSHADLVRANARLAVISAVVGAAVIGPSGAIYRLFGSEWVLRFAILAFFACTLASLRIRERERVLLPAADEEIRSVRLRSIEVVVAGVPMGLMRMTVGFLAFGIAFSFRTDDVSTIWFAVALIASGAGNFAGNLVGPRLREKAGEERIVEGSLVVGASAALVLAFAAGVGSAAVLAFFIAIAAAAARLAFDAIVQQDAPPEARGRFFARAETAFQILWVIGAMVPVLFDIPLSAVFVTIGVIELVALGVYIYGRVRVRERLARGEDIEATLFGAFPELRLIKRIGARRRTIVVTPTPTPTPSESGGIAPVGGLGEGDTGGENADIEADSDQGNLPDPPKA